MLTYSLALAAAIVVASPYWLFRMSWSGHYRHGLGQRLGMISPALRTFVGGRSTIWVHAVSVGEVIAASRLIERLRTVDPDLWMVISTTTRTGQKLAQERFDVDHAQMDTSSPRATRVFYYPLDFAWIVRRYLKALKPRALILVESELWPRMLVESEHAGIPVLVVNGRISNRSLPRYRALRKLWTPLLHKLTLVLAQSEEDRLRFVDIGVPPDKVRSAGNLKYDVRAAVELPITCASASEGQGDCRRQHTGRRGKTSSRRISRIAFRDSSTHHDSRAATSGALSLCRKIDRRCGPSPDSPLKLDATSRADRRRQRISSQLRR